MAGELEGAKAHLELDKPPQKSIAESKAFRAKQHFEMFKMLGG